MDSFYNRRHLFNINEPINKMETDLKVLLEIGDRIIAEDIQHLLEESNLYTLLDSDNAASSILTAYSGLNAIENLTLWVNIDDYQKAIEILLLSPYSDLIGNT